MTKGESMGGGGLHELKTLGGHSLKLAGVFTMLWLYAVDHANQVFPFPLHVFCSLDARTQTMGMRTAI